jgi:hypothetical protein
MTITVKLVLATCMTNTVNQHHTHKNDVGAPAAFTHITPNSTPPLLQQEQFFGRNPGTLAPSRLYSENQFGTKPGTNLERWHVLV